MVIRIRNAKPILWRVHLVLGRLALCSGLLVMAGCNSRSRETPAPALTSGPLNIDAEFSSLVPQLNGVTGFRYFYLPRFGDRRYAVSGALSAHDCQIHTEVVAAPLPGRQRNDSYSVSQAQCRSEIEQVVRLLDTPGLQPNCMDGPVISVEVVEQMRVRSAEGTSCDGRFASIAAILDRHLR